MSVPAETELAAMLVPSWARAKAKEMKNTPARVPRPPSSRNRLRRSRGDQIVSSYMTVEDDETIIPMKDVMAKPQGMVISWDHNASLGFFANRVKSGSLLFIKRKAN